LIEISWKLGSLSLERHLDPVPIAFLVRSLLELFQDFFVSLESGSLVRLNAEYIKLPQHVWLGFSDGQHGGSLWLLMSRSQDGGLVVRQDGAADDAPKAGVVEEQAALQVSDLARLTHHELVPVVVAEDDSQAQFCLPSRR
jgi:hypothetical protein